MLPCPFAQCHPTWQHYEDDPMLPLHTPDAEVGWLAIARTDTGALDTATDRIQFDRQQGTLVRTRPLPAIARLRALQVLRRMIGTLGYG